MTNRYRRFQDRSCRALGWLGGHKVTRVDVTHVPLLLLHTHPSMSACAAAGAAHARATAPHQPIRRHQRRAATKSVGTNKRAGSVSTAAAAAAAPTEELPPETWSQEWRKPFDGNTDDKLSTFLRAASEKLGGVDARFIVLGDGGILESVHPFPSEPRFAVWSGRHVISCYLTQEKRGTEFRCMTWRSTSPADIPRYTIRLP